MQFGYNKLFLPSNPDVLVGFGGEFFLKEKQCETADKNLISKAEYDEKENSEIEIDVKKEIDKVAEVINNLKETALKMKGAEVRMKDWSFLASYNEDEYLIDFKMRLAVKPEKM